MRATSYRRQTRVPVVLIVLVLLAGSLVAFPAAVGAATFEVTNTDDSGAGSLRQAIVNANANPGPDVIVVDLPALAVIQLLSPLPALTGQLEIESVNPVDVHGGAGIRVFAIAAGATVAISGLGMGYGDLTGANLDNGGAILNSGTLTVSSCAIYENSAHSGGGIYNEATGVLTIDSCDIGFNSLEIGENGDGGGVYSAGILTIVDSTVHDNASDNHGAGVYSTGILTIDGTDFEENEARSRGGGLLHDNDAAGVTLSIVDSVFKGNTAGQSGGGVSIEGGSATMSRSFFVVNQATNTNGGGIYVINASASIVASTVDGNAAGDFGGGIHNQGNITVSDSAIIRNSAEDGGGLYNSGNVGAVIEIVNSTLSGNSATDDGGGLFNVGDARLTHVTVTDNEATEEQGGGIFQGTGDTHLLALTATIVAGNRAPDGTNGAGPDIYGDVDTDGGNNLIGDDSDSTGLTEASNIINPGSTGLNPTLADNGGPTLTHAVLGAPILDHIAAADCTVTRDQRGVTRPQGDGCEIGAFEVYVQTLVQACLYAGALSQVRAVGEVAPGPLNCGRGVEVFLLAGGNPQDNSFDNDLYACLYAGSLSQVNADGPPANCGRGVAISLTTGIGLDACLYAGRLSQVGASSPNCGRGVPVELAQSYT